MEVKIETATLKLLDQLYQIEEQCFDQEAFTKRQIAYLLTDYNTIALVAKANSDIAGFIIAQVEVEENTEFGHIITINVAPNCRRQKIATKLLHEIESLLKQKGISECRLEVREDNHPAIKLYHSLGYQTMGKLEKYYGKKHGIYLKKIL
ncbi:MAG: ribosomal protein S18-alanine N-acetyltransferase [Candidatus Bathyarchaeota archaeon]|nr:ribosomal protein S18-alanine N-acetyltransferase [Candidatus Bathyarchaeota archaeon]